MGEHGPEGPVVPTKPGKWVYLGYITSIGVKALQGSLARQ